MLRSMPPRWIETHGSSLNSFWGWKASFLPRAAEDQQHQDRDRRSRRRARSGLLVLVFIALPRLRSSGSKRWAMPWAAKETVKRTRRGRRRRARPRVRRAGRRAAPRSPSARRGRAWSRRRSPSPAGGCRRRSSSSARRAASIWIAALGEPGGGARRRSRAWASPPSRKTASAAASDQQVDVLGRRHKIRPSRVERADARLYPKGPTIGFLEPVREACHNLLLASRCSRAIIRRARSPRISAGLRD